MNDFFSNVAANIVANTIGAALTLLIIFLLSAINKNKLLSFFKISSSKPSVGIFVSHLIIMPGGSRGVDKKLKLGYSGPAINQIEYTGALRVREILRSRFLSLLPRSLQETLRNQSSSILTLYPSIDVSPDIERFSLPDCDILILLGSSVYNSLTHHYLQDKRSLYYFGRDEQNNFVLFTRGGGSLEGRPNQELGIVQRITDRKQNKVIFICAGLGTSATYGCTLYLIKHWRKLHKEFRDRDFVVLLTFKDQLPDSPDVVEPSDVKESFLPSE